MEGPVGNSFLREIREYKGSNGVATRNSLVYGEGKALHARFEYFLYVYVEFKDLITLVVRRLD